MAYFYTMDDMKHFYEKHIRDFKGKNPYMATKKTAEEIVRGVKEVNGIVSAAHPRARTTWDLPRKIKCGKIKESVLDDIHCAEVICGLLLRKMNLRAVKWAMEQGMGITGGSDGHTLHKLGSVVTYSKADDAESFLDSIRKQRNFVTGTETKMPSRALSYSKAVTKHSRYVGPSVKIHYGLAFKDGMENIREKISNGRHALRHRRR